MLSIMHVNVEKYFFIQKSECDIDNWEWIIIGIFINRYANAENHNILLKFKSILKIFYMIHSYVFITMCFIF